MDRDAFLNTLQTLRMAPSDRGGRHPHKPLLLLWLLARAQHGDFGPFSYDDVEGPVDDLLAEFGTPAKRDRGRAAMPFFHLEAEVWETWATIEGEELSDRTHPTNPTTAWRCARCITSCSTSASSASRPTITSWHWREVFHGAGLVA